MSRLRCRTFAMSVATEPVIIVPNCAACCARCAWCRATTPPPERIELYQLHAVDHRIPIEDSLGALVDLQRDGKIHHVGVSNVSAGELARARAVANIVSVQNCYNLSERSSDRLIDMCAGAGIAFIPWYPLAAGRLASPNSPLARIAQSHGATPGQIALAWLLQRSPAIANSRDLL